MYATLDGSCGLARGCRSITVGQAVKALLMEDYGTLVENLTSVDVDQPFCSNNRSRACGSSPRVIVQISLLTYLRYYVELECDSLKNDLGLDVSRDQVEP
jgi:hypothetical protein